MDVVRFLNWLDEIELRMEQIYSWLAGVFQEDPELSGLFSRMSREESGHSINVKFAIRMVMGNRREFPEIDLDPEQLKAVIAGLDAFKANNPSPSLKQALQFAISAEADESKIALTRTIAQSHPKLAGVLKDINRYDRTHLETLRECALRHNLVIPDQPAQARPQFQARFK